MCSLAKEKNRRKGDLILFNEEFPGMYGTITCDPYSKPVWGSSGHDDDIAIVSMISVFLGPHWGGDAGRTVNYKYTVLRRIASVVQ